ncbi:MAG: YcxB family protein [Lachnospirales bacterium]
MNKTFTIETLLTEKIYRTYIKFHVYNRNKDWLLIPILSFVILIFALINLFTNSPILAFIFIILAIYLLLSRFLRFYISVNRICKQFNLSSAPKYFYTLEFCGENLLVFSKTENTEYPLNKIFHIYIFNNILYIYINKNSAFIAPLNEFSQNEKENLIQLISNNINTDKITFVDQRR